MLSSKIERYSLGVALEDKKPGSDILIVQPTEALTNKSGDLTVYEHEHGDIIGNNRVEAMWINYSDIRETAPDIVTGEKVELLRYAKTDMYYWYSIGRSNPLRRLEHIQWNLSNTPDRDEEANRDNQLFIVASTRDGYIEVITPQNREEKCLLRFKADFKDGKIIFSDGNGGSWSWNTVSGKIRLKAKEVYWDVPKVVINGKVLIKKRLTVMGATMLMQQVKVVGKVTVIGVVKIFGIAFAFLFKHL